MLFRISVVFLATIIAMTWSHGVPSKKIRIRRNKDIPNIGLNIVQSQIKNNITIGSLPAGSKVVGGSVLTQTNNDYIAISDTGKLLIVMPDIVTNPEPLTVLGLNDSELSKLLSLTPQQRNVQVIINLRQSLSILQEYCERISQLVDKHIEQDDRISGSDHKSDSTKNFHRNIWYVTLRFHWMDLMNHQSDLDELMVKIKDHDPITDMEVAKARSKMNATLKSHKELTEDSQRVFNDA